MGFKIILRRFVECWRESGMLAWQSVLYLGVLLPLVSILGFEHVGRLWKPDIETLLAFLTGRYTELSDGKRAPLSIANLMDGSFETPGYQPRTHFPAAVSRGLAGPGTATSAGPDGAGAEVPAQACNGVPHQACSGVFPRACNGLADKACGQGPAVSCNGLPDQANEAALAGSCDGLPDQACEGRPAGLTLPDEALWGPVDSPLNAHFLSLCSKLMYEERDVVRDVVSQRCESPSMKAPLMCSFLRASFVGKWSRPPPHIWHMPAHSRHDRRSHRRARARACVCVRGRACVCVFWVGAVRRAFMTSSAIS
eukprot:jgi/Botrbrau1/23527/Bobra.0499s0001.1